MWLTLFRWRLPTAQAAPARPPAARPVRVLRSRRSAATAVAIGLAVFAAAQLGLGWAVHTERSPLRDPIYFDKLAILRTHRAFFPAAPDVPADRPATVLFVGSSRTLNAINARAATQHLTAALGRPVETFNFGQAGAGPVTNAVYVRRLQQEGMKADYALIEVHPVFLDGHRPDPPETKWLLPFRLRPDELPVVRAMGFPAADPVVHGSRGFIAPWYEYRFLLVDRYAPFFVMNNSRLNGGHEPDAHGFARLKDDMDAASKAGLLRMAWGQYAYYFDGYRPNGPGVTAIRDTLDRCLAEGCKPALILMPESTEWRSWYAPEGLKELDGVVGRLAAEYGVPLFDARTWVPDDASADGHHLTGRGADAFTEKLVRDALAPWIAKTSASQNRPAP